MSEITHPTTNHNPPEQQAVEKKVLSPTWEELLEMETSANIADSYLELLCSILTPPAGIDDPDPGLEQFDTPSARFAMSFLIGEIFVALKNHDTLIKYSYETLQRQKSKEVKS